MDRKKANILAVVSVLSVLLLAAIAYAHGGGWRGNGMYGTYHEQMEEVLENGNYQDFLDLKDELGRNMMPWLNSEEEFQQMQERHATMEEFHEQSGYRMPCHGNWD